MPPRGSIERPVDHRAGVLPVRRDSATFLVDGWGRSPCYVLLTITLNQPCQIHVQY
jgi:hypothetical protein